MLSFFKRKNEALQPSFEDFPPIGGLLVSKMVAEDRKKPMFMYREKPTREEDSGWRIFSGLESEDYNGNPRNIGIYNPSTILKIDSSIAPLLLKGIGSVFERDQEEMVWRPVHDYPLEDDYMTEQPVGEGWVMPINNLFLRKVEDKGGLYFSTGDKSVRIVDHGSAKNQSELYAEHQAIVNARDQSLSKTLEKFEFSDAEVSRLGYLIKESGEGKEYDVIYGFCIADRQVLQVALYYDEQEDKKWALDTWKNIKFKQK